MEKQLKSETRYKQDSDDSRQEIDNVYKQKTYLAFHLS